MTLQKFPAVIVGGGPVGVFLSNLLSSYGVNSCIIEKRLLPTTHPQAHYINSRSMEILKYHSPSSFDNIIRMTSDVNDWRHFSYCYSILQREYCRIDHLNPLQTASQFWQESCTSVTHLPQNHFEEVIQCHTKSLQKENFQNHFFGYEAFHIQINGGKINITLKPTNNNKISIVHETLQLQCDYLIAADGAHSTIRTKCGINLTGKEKIQNLLNVHFTCPGLGERIYKQKKQAMLYFVFNEEMVAVFVAHDIQKDIWISQIPLFTPPAITPGEQYMSTEEILQLLYCGLGIQNETQLKSQLKILSVRPWFMHAQVADSFTHNGNILLVGDAAHRMPPAGGFGLNTGLQDAHNVAWKLAMVIHCRAKKELLSTYSEERLPVAVANTSLSLSNFHRTTAAARCLGLDADLARLVTSAASSAPFLPLALRRGLVSGAVRAGLSPLRLLREPGSVLEPVTVSRLKRMLLGRGAGLPLIFPEEDLHFRYRTGALWQDDTDPLQQQKQEGVYPDPRNTDSSSSSSSGGGKKYLTPGLRVGARIPHFWLCSLNNRNENSSSSSSDRDRDRDRDKAWLSSSVGIPSLIHRLLNSSYHSLPSEGPGSGSGSGSGAPLFPIFISSKYEILWIQAIDQWNKGAVGLPESEGGRGPYPVFCLVSILNQTLEPVHTGISHDELQRDYQYPRIIDIKDKEKEMDTSETHLTNIGYDKSKQDDPENILSTHLPLQKKFKQAYQVDSSSSSNSIDNSSLSRESGVYCLRVQDLTNRWMELNDRFHFETNDSTTTNSSSSKMDSCVSAKTCSASHVAVIVRPDGHIASMKEFEYNAASISVIADFLKVSSDKLFLN